LVLHIFGVPSFFLADFEAIVLKLLNFPIPSNMSILISKARLELFGCGVEALYTRQ
jgi:hypothetical protein